MSRLAVMRLPAYTSARLLAEAAVWRAIQAPPTLSDEELEVRIALDQFATQIIGIIYAAPIWEAER